MQHVDTRRGLFEQAFGLSTVVVHTAAGSHTIPLLPAPEADELRTRIAGLARTEEEKRSPLSEPTPKPDERRLHPSALVIYSADALRNAAFPLLVILGVTLLGGPLDTRALLQAAIYGGIGLVIAVSVGAISTSHQLLHRPRGDPPPDGRAVEEGHRHPARPDPGDRRPPGPLQRAFGVFSVDIQTGAGKKGGEISLPALTPAAVEELRRRGHRRRPRRGSTRRPGRRSASRAATC